MFKNDNQIGQEYWQKNKYNHCGSQKNLRKFGNSTNKSHKKSPKLMVRHGTNNHDS